MSEQAQALAVKFHDLYEELAPQFGYATREETRQFSPDTPNGKLMIAVCGKLLEDCVIFLASGPAEPAVEAAPAPLSELGQRILDFVKKEFTWLDKGLVDVDLEFEEIGFDSLDRYELGYALEEEFEVEISNAQIIQTKTLREMIDLVDQLMNQSAPA